MKRALGILLVTVIVCHATVVSFDWYSSPTSTLNDGLFFYYKMEEASGTRSDSKIGGTAQDLTDNNTVTQDTGIIGNCAFFTRANSEFLSHADSADLSVGDEDFTIAAWIKGTTLEFDGHIACQWAATGNERSWRMWFHSAAGKFAFSVSSNGTDETILDATTFGTPLTNQWHFVVVQHNSVANTISISVNNGAPNTLSYSSGVHDSTADFMIGARVGPIGFIDGAIDEVSGWRRVLASYEITEAYNSGSARTCCPY